MFGQFPLYLALSSPYFDIVLTHNHDTAFTFCICTSCKQRHEQIRTHNWTRQTCESLCVSTVCVGPTTCVFVCVFWSWNFCTSRLWDSSWIWLRVLQPRMRGSKQDGFSYFSCRHSFFPSVALLILFENAWEKEKEILFDLSFTFSVVSKLFRERMWKKERLVSHFKKIPGSIWFDLVGEERISMSQSKVIDSLLAGT